MHRSRSRMSRTSWQRYEEYVSFHICTDLFSYSRSFFLMSLFVYIGHDPGWVGRHGAGMKSMLLMSLFINEFSCHSCRSLFMYVCLFCKSLFVCMRMLYKRIFFFLQNSCYAYRSLFMRVGLFWQVSFCTYAYVIYVTFFLNSELLLLIQVSFDVCRSLLTRLFVYEWVAMKGELDVMAQVWGVSYMVLLHTCTNSCCCCVCCCFIHVQNVAHSYAYTYMFLSCILVLKYHFFEVYRSLLVSIRLCWPVWTRWRRTLQYMQTSADGHL